MYVFYLSTACGYYYYSFNTAHTDLTPDSNLINFSHMKNIHEYVQQILNK